MLRHTETGSCPLPARRGISVGPLPWHGLKAGQAGTAVQQAAGDALPDARRHRSEFADDGFALLALLLRHLQLRSRMAHGHYHRSLFIGLQAQQLMQAGGIEVAHSARAKSLLGGCHADVLGSDGDVDVAMTLAVTAHPLLLVAHYTYYI